MDFDRAGVPTARSSTLAERAASFDPVAWPSRLPRTRTAGPGQLPDGGDPGLVEAPFCRWSDAPYQSDGKGIEKVALIARSDGDETVRLGHL